ncbi:MAG: OprO/OprP family phosphate-selective porin, partial [Nannocystaceae bacterium]|nr:OprO/OprP family phosphate-selective porin [Nannocystaceae bacterium]
PSAIPAVEPSAPADEEPAREAGAHLRPKRESVLLRDHEVDISKARYRPGLGLEFKSSDGRFALATRLRAQFRYTLNHDGEAGETTQGMQIRRARLQFKGHFWNEHNKFKTEFALSPRDMGLRDGAASRTPILDWYLDFTYLRDLSLRVGQYKLPYSRQRVVSSGDLQLVDRSIANSEFTVDRDIGFDLHSKDLFGLGRLRYNAGIYMGEGRDQYQTDTFEMLYVGRVEVLPFGMFKDYKEADFERSLKPRLSLGVGYAYMDGGKRNRGVTGSTPTDGGTTDYQNATVDVVFKIAGFSLFSDFFFRNGTRSFGDATIVDESGIESPADLEAARNGLGWSAQVGYLLPRTSLELAGRYGQTRKTQDDSGVPDRDEAGGGLSYYFAGHPLKLQLDYFARWEGMPEDKTDHEVRLQLQAAF